MKHSTERILTTHCGSLPRPHALLDQMKSRASGAVVDDQTYDAGLRQAVQAIVKRQADVGIDVVTDGEQGKLGFFSYISERLAGFEARPAEKFTLFAAEVQAFPEYYEQYFRQAMLGGTAAPIVPLVCTGPVSYRGQAALQRDIANLKAALEGVSVAEVFMPAVAPSGVGSNAYYGSEEEYLMAVADALREEYRAIVDAGFLVQIDDPFLSDIYSYSGLEPKAKRETAELYVAAINRGLQGIPRDRVRFHTCYGINEGPRVHDAELKDMVDVLLTINAGAMSFEAANPRHEHDYHAWEGVKVPSDLVLIPGVITHAHNIVEHPQVIAERLFHYTNIVGRENVIAGGDCGFSSQATYNPEIHPTVVWAKFQAMAEGARLASQQLWR